MVDYLRYYTLLGGSITILRERIQIRRRENYRKGGRSNFLSRKVSIIDKEIEKRVMGRYE